MKEERAEDYGAFLSSLLTKVGLKVPFKLC
jgi:hypothetical protein